MKKAAFDLGNIVVEIDWKPFIKEWKALSLNRYSLAEEFFNGFQELQDVGLTTVSREIKKRFHDLEEDSVNRLIKGWNDALVYSDVMFSFINKLKDSGYLIAILSNIGREHASVMRTKFPEIFNDAILHLSYEVGARKPSKLYFQSFILEYPEFKGVTYIDDRLENLIVGQKYGLNGCLFDLEKFGGLSRKEKSREMDRLHRAVGFFE